MKIFLVILASTLSLNAQTAPVWTMQNSGSHASLRGIHSVDGKVAWASGSGGTVLRTVDGGEHWTQCATPDAAKDGAKLDFRGVQAWDANTAIVMSSGPGELSRLYKTTDGCKTWKLLFMNPDSPDGFFDSFTFITSFSENGANADFGLLIGDPVKGELSIYETHNGGINWERLHDPALNTKAAAFAASNQCLTYTQSFNFIIGGTKQNSVLNLVYVNKFPGNDNSPIKRKWYQYPLPLTSGKESAGPFAINNREEVSYGKNIDNSVLISTSAILIPHQIVVGGDYTKPNESSGTAAWSSDGGKTWTAAAKPPHGYRSTVQWSEALKLWLTAGTNGSDYSTDDGKTWLPLDDGNWNALSLPFLVGPDGRIARLNEAALAEKLKPTNPQK